MRIFVEALVIFFATLLIAALVALGLPTQASAQGVSAPSVAGATQPAAARPCCRALAASGLG